MTSHELARQLLEGPDANLRVSIDVSTCCLDSGNRVFCEHIPDGVEIMRHEDYYPPRVRELTILLMGEMNFRYVGEYEPGECSCEGCKRRVASDELVLKALNGEVEKAKDW